MFTPKKCYPSNTLNMDSIFYPSFCTVRGMNECCASNKMTKCHLLMNEPHYQMTVGMPVSGLGYAVVLKQEINKLKALRRAKGPFKRLDFLLTFLSMKKVRNTVGEENLKLKESFKL